MTELNFDVAFISFDEPNCESNWKNVQEIFPEAFRVHGIKGFDESHQQAAKQSNKSFVLIIDGDCKIYNHFRYDLNRVCFEKLKKTHVYSWCALNSINGLVYGNGGPKLWPTNILRSVNSHQKNQTLDWIDEIPYLTFNNCYGISEINCTPFQAFRAGLREGTKFGSNINSQVPVSAQMNFDNLWRLRTWMCVGAHVPNGEIACLGTRLGFWLTVSKNWDPNSIKDYSFLKAKWQTDWKFIEEGHYHEYLSFMCHEINRLYDLSIADLNSSQSQFFQVQLKNPKRSYQTEELFAKDSVI